MATTQNTFNGNGSNLGPFLFTFKWLESTDIKVSVGGVLKTAGTHYNLQGLNYTTKTGGQVLFTAGNAPPVGTNNIRIYRDTDDEVLSSVFSSGSAIRAKDLNDNFTQNLYVTQEINNNALNVDGSNAMVGNLDINNFKVINSSAPLNGTDLANKTYVDDRVSTSAVAGSPYFLQDGAGAVNRSWSSKLKDVVSVKDFGAVGDGVADDTAAIKLAISAAIAAGRKRVILPSGSYVISDTLDLDGTPLGTNYGVVLQGEDTVASKLLFKPATTTTPCITLSGGSAATTNKQVHSLTIEPFDSSYNYKGIGIYIDGQCFSVVEDVNINRLNYGLHVCNRHVGSFSEFNTFNRIHLLYNNQGIRFERDGGNESFHGNRFTNVLVNMADGQFGIYCVGTSGPGYIYNCYFRINMFVDPGATGTGIYVNNTTTDFNDGFITCENPVVLQAAANGQWNMYGKFRSLGGFSYAAGTPNGAFCFDNSRKSSTFTNAAINTLTPNALQGSIVDENGNGDYPAVFRISGSNIDSVGISTYSASANSVYLGSVGFGQTLEAFTPWFKFNTSNGSVLQGYATDYYLCDSTGTSNQLRLKGGRVGGNIGRSQTYSVTANAGVAQNISTITNADKTKLSMVYFTIGGSNFEKRYLLAINNNGYGSSGYVNTLATIWELGVAGVTGPTFSVNSNGTLVVAITTDRNLTITCQEIGLGGQLLD